MWRVIRAGCLPLACLALSCTASNVTADIEGEPICPDFEVGAARTKMKGGLRRPVQVLVLEDPDDEDEDAVSARTLLGRRTSEATTPKVLVQDRDHTYTVRWVQCTNERAPRPVKVEQRNVDEIASYECGEAKRYAQTELKIRKGDAASRRLQFVPPPEAGCWVDQVPVRPEPTSSATADAGGAPSAAPPVDAGPDAASATDAATSAAVAPAAPPTAGAQSAPPQGRAARDAGP